MLHKFLDDGDWFAAKRYGYGAGLPIAWQGWVLLAAYIGVMLGLGMLAGTNWPVGAIAAFAAIFVLTAIFVAIVHRRTRGGWRWRWGDES